MTRNKIALAWSAAKILNDGSSGLFRKELGRMALLGVVFCLTSLATIGSSSTGEGITERLIPPAASPQQGSVSGGNGFYHRPRNPGFHHLTGS